MAVLPLRVRGLLFILLLGGNEIATIHGRRSIRVAHEIAKEASNLFQDPQVPADDSGCKKKGFWKGHCKPQKYCYRERRGMLKRDKCRVKWIYRSDEELAGKFATASSKLILGSEKLRKSGKIGTLHQMVELKKLYEEMGKASSAAASEVPKPKTLLNRLKTSFQQDQIIAYAQVVDSVGKVEGVNTKDFNLDGLDGDDTPLRNTLERVQENFDIGFKRVGSKINFAEMMKLGALTEDPGPEALKAQLKKAAPHLTPAQLDEVVSKGTAKKESYAKECGNSAECMNGHYEETIEKLAQEAAQAEDKSVSSLLQYAESKGLSLAKPGGKDDDRIKRAMTLLEQHGESGDDELDEHGKALIDWMAWGFFLAMVTFIVIAILCNPFICMVVAAFFAGVLGAFWLARNGVGG